MPGVVYTSDYMCTSMCLYIIIICIDGVIIDMCPYVVVAAVSTEYYWINVYCLCCTSMQILCRDRCICVPVHVLLLHPISYNMGQCGFSLTVFVI